MTTATWPADSKPATGPLRGIRILDLTTVLMGPSATQLLADLGADVVKIETPAGDIMRWVGPWHTPGMGPLFLWANRNKRSLTLDLKSPQGKQAAIALATQADVLVSNVRPQAIARLGLDYATIRAANPKIIYCAAVGYGSAGPNAGKAVYDDLMQAASGLAGLFATQQAQHGQEGTHQAAPRYIPANICDRIVGLYVSNAITAALIHRTQTGEGQEIEVPMFETMAQFILSDHIGGAAFAPPEGPMGYNRLLSNTRRPYQTANGFLAIVVYTNAHWQAFSNLIGQPDLLQTDPRFATQQSRTQHAVAMGEFLATQLQSRTTQQWLTALHEIDIPACPVNMIEDLLTDPHLAATNFFDTVEHPTEGPLTTARFPIHFSQSPANIRRLAPNLGEHNTEFLTASQSPNASASAQPLPTSPQTPAR